MIATQESCKAVPSAFAAAVLGNSRGASWQSRETAASGWWGGVEELLGDAVKSDLSEATKPTGTIQKKMSQNTPTDTAARRTRRLRSEMPRFWRWFACACSGGAPWQRDSALHKQVLGLSLGAHPGAPCN